MVEQLEHHLMLAQHQRHCSVAQELKPCVWLGAQQPTHCMQAYQPKAKMTTIGLRCQAANSAWQPPRWHFLSPNPICIAHIRPSRRCLITAAANSSGRQLRAGPLAAPAAQKKSVQEVVHVITKYKQQVTKGQQRQQEVHRHVPTYAADIVSLCLSLGRAYSRSESGVKPAMQGPATEAAQWLAGQAVIVVQQGFTSGEGRAPVPLADLAALAASLRSLAAINRDSLKADTLLIAQEIAGHVSQRLMQSKERLPSMRAWSDLLWGLTAAGLNLGNSSAMHPLLDQGVQQVVQLLSSSRSAGRLQDISLILVAYAHAGYTGDLGSLVKALAGHLQSQGGSGSGSGSGSGRGGPQEVSNMLWALGKLTQAHPGAYSPAVYDWGVRQLCTMVGQARPQHLSSAMYGCALARHHSGSVSQLMTAICTHPSAMATARAQEWANLLWAAAILGKSGVSQQPDTIVQCAHQLLAQLSSSLINTSKAGAGLGQVGASQEWSNIIWAAATLGWYDKVLFSCGTAAVAACKASTIKPQALSSKLYAAAVCAHWEAHIPQLVKQLGTAPAAGLNPQVLCNALYSWAVLMAVAQQEGELQQQDPQHQEMSSTATQLLQEASRWPVSGYSREALGQLLGAHMYAQTIGMGGLPEGDVLGAAMSTGWTASQVSISDGQRQVARALEQLGYRVAVEQRSPDGLMSADVVVSALPGGGPCSIAVEYDGPSHYVLQHSSGCSTVLEPDSKLQQVHRQDSSLLGKYTSHRLDGSSRLRNALLRARYPGGVVCVPWFEWDALTSEEERRQYLQHALQPTLLQASC